MTEIARHRAIPIHQTNGSNVYRVRREDIGTPVDLSARDLDGIKKAIDTVLAMQGKK